MGKNTAAIKDDEFVSKIATDLTTPVNTGEPIATYFTHLAKK